MVKTRSQKAKEEESNNGNGRVTKNSQKAKTKAHPHASDTVGIRKSLREKPSKNSFASSSRNPKSSKEVKKGTLPAPKARRKPERKMKTPSPDENVEHNGEITSQVKREKMPAQMYRSLFNIRNKGTLVFCMMSFFFANFLLVYSGMSVITYTNVIQSNVI